jgi:hypothetical protein
MGVVPPARDLHPVPIQRGEVELLNDTDFEEAPAVVAPKVLCLFFPSDQNAKKELMGLLFGWKSILHQDSKGKIR